MINFKELLIEAIKTKNELAKSTLRMLISDQEKLEKSGQVVDTIKLVQKGITSRKESLGYAITGNRTELANELIKEIEYLESFLPKQISEEKLIDIISSLKEEFGLSGVKDMKVLIGLVNNRVAGQIDGKLIGRHCKIALS
jgi:uncharacterized protein YqeY